jgi:hypothetical protein
VNSVRGGVRALLECDFLLLTPTFRVGVESGSAGVPLSMKN